MSASDAETVRPLQFCPNVRLVTVGASGMTSGASPGPATAEVAGPARFQFDLRPKRRESSDRRALTLNEGSERIGRHLVKTPDVHGLDLAGAEQLVHERAADAESLGSLDD